MIQYYLNNNMDKMYHNWEKSINSRINFYNKSKVKIRTDEELHWDWFYSSLGWKEKLHPYAKKILNLLRKIKHGELFFNQRNWFNVNSKSIWMVRCKLNDELSKSILDSYIILVVCGPEKYFFPRLNFEDMLTIEKEGDFTENLPKNYGGLPLKLFDVKIPNTNLEKIRLVSSKQGIDLINNYKQYFMERGEVSFKPLKGDVVFDCGSCIGDISMIFAAFTGQSGQIHLFDPVPLHNRYCRIQAKNNPIFSKTLIINELAVNDISNKFIGNKKDVDVISPGGCCIDDYEATSLDDYVKKNSIKKVDYIKMDIEGFELKALQGASETIEKFKPKLAISCYHKDDDLWEITNLILKINPTYKIYFDHHMPIQWEAVLYAIEQ